MITLMMMMMTMMISVHCWKTEQPGQVDGREREAVLAERFETRVEWTTEGQPASCQEDTTNSHR